jgi:hypothetical protein
MPGGRLARGIGAAALALGLGLALACAREEAPASPADPAESARLEAALQSLEGTTQRVRGEVLRTCDKWRHRDRPCVENEVRRAQLLCWAEEGRPRWEHAQKRGLGPYSGDRAVMRVQNLCMGKQGWRKTQRSTF